MSPLALPHKLLSSGVRLQTLAAISPRKTAVSRSRRRWPAEVEQPPRSSAEENPPACSRWRRSGGQVVADARQPGRRRQPAVVDVNRRYHPRRVSGRPTPTSSASAARLASVPARGTALDARPGGRHRRSSLPWIGGPRRRSPPGRARRHRSRCQRQHSHAHRGGVRVMGPSSTRKRPASRHTRRPRPATRGARPGCRCTGRPRRGEAKRHGQRQPALPRN